ncbi:ATP-binding protein [Tepidibacter sp. Z1-5]|uniref:ATP-binding protein n=1 Tax=Tepidibacter sp. Z1-5 TaxID=3134138 RepID=UPI0030BBBC62
MNQTYSCYFLVIFDMNPCHFGYFLDSSNKKYKCSASEINRYLNRASSPLLDIIGHKNKSQKLFGVPQYGFGRLLI